MISKAIVQRRKRHKQFGGRKKKLPKHFSLVGTGPIYAAFAHAGLTTRYRTKSLYKRIFLLSRHAIWRKWKACLKLQAWNLSF